MEVSINFDTGNAAFDDPGELARILRDLADNIDARSADSGDIRDANGNRVGTWEVSEDRNEFRR